ncbi:DUF1361 domain-containing protein [Microbacterium betulae]|uniref:DUF1361 domain-containing protein n=1 Tax=Microbacterium betulae TaxID=2981139 RepID=A0AA97I6X2_9MICO|nr:DUF1361 domain-containing protein [Microbacterium sp. AB]WOF24299.1 DUF1361 domain-containing protein [Microbacterium sp. AB]
MAVFVACVSVVLLNVYAGVLVLLRSWVYGVRLYRPMLLNIALSFVPVLGAIVAVAGLFGLPALLSLTSVRPGIASAAIWVYLIAGTCVWVLFFPNAIYLITELNFSHRRDDDPVPLWYDIVQTLTLTLSGIANAVLSLAVVQTAFVLLIDPDSSDAVPASSWAFAGVIIVLGAVGVYLGRYLRFNSWDARHPASLLRKLGSHLRQRGKALEAGGFVLTHAVLIGLVYAPVYGLGYRALVAG